MERMNTAGISPQQLAEALATPALPGISPGTMNFVGNQVTAIVSDEGFDRDRLHHTRGLQSMTGDALLTDLHARSRHNRSWLQRSRVCGCFHCCNEYPFEQIDAWTDDGLTAICPRCGVDSVLGFASKTADQSLLREMHDHWFGPAAAPTAEEWKAGLAQNKWIATTAKPPARK